MSVYQMTYDRVFSLVSTLSAPNRGRVESFLRESAARGLKPESVYTQLRALRSLDLALKGKPMDRLTPGQLVDWVGWLRKEGFGEGTIRLMKVHVKSALRRWAGGAVAPEMEAVLRHRGNGRRLPADSLVSREEVLAAARAARNQRDRAMLLTLYESGFRVGELVALNVGSVSFTPEGGAEIVIPERNGGVKTGGRAVWVFDAAPDLKLWLNQHPLRDSPEAPLWTNFSNRKGERLTRGAVQYLVPMLFREAGIKRKVWPHLLRHSRLTELAACLPESDLRVVAGWSPGSDMPAIYVHRSAADVKRKLKRLKGVATEEEKAKEDRNPLAPLRCPNLACGATNPAGFAYCGRCGGPLTAEAARRRKELMAEVHDLGEGAIKRGGLTEENMVAEMKARLLAAKARAERELGLA